MDVERPGFELGVFILLLSIASAILPTIVPLNTLGYYIFGTIIFFISGLLLCIGGSKQNFDVTTAGLIFGILAWNILIIININGIFWNYAKLEIYDTLYMRIFLLEILTGIYFMFFYWMIKVNFLGQKTRFFYQIGFYGSIIHLIITIVSLILGIIMYLMMKASWDKYRF